MHRTLESIGFALVLGLAAGAAQPATLDTLVEQALTGNHRAEGNAVRNRHRHPLATLKFFGLDPSMTVVEIWPSSGWYAEILAPVLREHGKYCAAGYALSANRPPKWRKNLQRKFQAKLAARPDVYDRVIVTELSVPERTEIAPPGSADMVLTFRNVHNWMNGDYAQELFVAMFRALKPGGVLGVVEHRAKEGTTLAAMKKSGYVTEARVIAFAENAGFQLAAKSDVNANPKDATDHPKGVWTLPPSLRLGDQDRDIYVAIGESDRMTVRFVKPVNERASDERPGD